MTYKEGILSLVLLLSIVHRSYGALTAQQVIITDKKGDFESAQDICKGLQFYLIRIESDADNKLVNDLAGVKGLNAFWIDGNDLDSPKKFVNWKSTVLTYTNWAAGQPDPSKIYGSCIEVRTDYSWYNNICSVENNVICYDEDAVPIVDPTPLDPNDIYVSKVKAAIDDAKKYCNGLGLKVIRINTDADNQVLANVAQTNNWNKFWLDANRAADGSWTNADNIPVTFTKWAPGQPDNLGGSENCIEVDKTGLWDDTVCTVQNSVGCFIYHNKRPPVNTNITPKQILVTDKVGDFQAAQDYCTSLGLRLIRLKNEAESQVVNSLIAAKGIKKYWTDANDNKAPGTWVNSHNLQVKYKKWGPGKPSAGGNTHCAEVDDTQTWSDVPCSNQDAIVCFNKDGPIPPALTTTTTAPVITTAAPVITTAAPVIPTTTLPATTTTSSSMLIPPPTLKPEDIFVTEKKGDFTTAQKLCQSSGMKLIRINNADENKYILSLAASKNVGNFWIDGSDVKTEGNWINSDNLALKYKNWAANQPDNYQNNEHCIEVWNTGVWNDVRCSAQNAIICFLEQPRCNQVAQNQPVCLTKSCVKTPTGLKAADVVVTNKRGTFNCAQNYCKSLGLNIITVKSDQDNKLVHDMSLVRNIGRYWVDGNDLQKEGNWVNTGNKVLNYKKWQAGQPDNLGGKEHCAEVHFFQTDFWNDMECNTINGIICGRNVCSNCASAI